MIIPAKLTVGLLAGTPTVTLPPDGMGVKAVGGTWFRHFPSEKSFPTGQLPQDPLYYRIFSIKAIDLSHKYCRQLTPQSGCYWVSNCLALSRDQSRHPRF